MKQLDAPASAPPFEGVIAAGALALPDTIHHGGWVLVRDGRIAGAGASDPPPEPPRASLPGHLLAPGFVDLHVHGGDGAEVNGEDPGAVAAAVGRIARFHARHGTTALLATTVTDAAPRLAATIAGIAAATARASGGARVAGAHLEGPWLSAHRMGAQNPAARRDFDAAELQALLTAARGTLRLVTLAPETPGALDAIRTLTAAGVAVSLGHTDADHATARAAIAAGARHATHAFNAMSAMDHRRPGVVGAVLAAREVSVELIADGHHVHPTVLAVAFRAAARPVLVTDAIAATGGADGTHALGGLPVVVRDGCATLAGDPTTLAGSVLTMDRAVAVMAGRAGVPLHDVLRAASATPAATIGRHDLGALTAGAPADLVLLDRDSLAAAATLVGGAVVHDPAGRLSQR